MKYCTKCENFQSARDKCKFFNIYITSISNAEICSKYKEKTNKKISNNEEGKKVMCRNCKNFILNSYCKIKKDLIKNENKIINCEEYINSSI